MHRRVLLIDNDPDLLETRTELLSQQGYRVYTASTLEEAAQCLAQTWIHVAVVDVRMRDENDDKDISGILFAKDPRYRTVPKMILTRFPSYEQVREVMGPVLDGLPAAVDFVNKLAGLEAMVKALDETFDKFVRVDQNVRIRWQKQGSFAMLAAMIAAMIDEDDSPAHPLEHAIELEDLFRRLFYQRKQITLGPPLLIGEQYVILEVTAYHAGQNGRQIIVSCGRRAAIADKGNRYTQFAAPNEGKGSTVLEAEATTLNFAARAYRLVGGRVNEIKRFAEYYQANLSAGVVTAIEHLYRGALHGWHERQRRYVAEATQAQDVAGLLDLRVEMLTPAAVAPAIEAICRQASNRGLASLEFDGNQITVRLTPDRVLTLPNPAYCLTLDIELGPGVYGAIHGDVRPDNLLVDATGQTWLVDFAHAGFGPLLFDFVRMETAIKHELLDSELALRLAIEEQLLTATRLDDPLGPNMPPEQEKALRGITKLRKLAAAVAGPELPPYLLSLLLCTLEPLVRFDPTLQYERGELVDAVHSLMASALLCQRLTQLSQPGRELPPPAVDGVWVDRENREVWVRGRKADISPQEYTIVSYLEEHTGRLCTRRAIFEEALGQAYQNDALERTRVDSAMSRLRQKIELDPANPRHIHTVRGQGYRFEH